MKSRIQMFPFMGSAFDVVSENPQMFSGKVIEIFSFVFSCTSYRLFFVVAVVL